MKYQFHLSSYPIEIIPALYFAITHCAFNEHSLCPFCALIAQQVHNKCTVNAQ